MARLQFFSGTTDDIDVNATKITYIFSLLEFDVKRFNAFEERMGPYSNKTKPLSGWHIDRTVEVHIL